MLAAAAAVNAALVYVAPGHLQELALLGAALVPLALAAAGYAVYPRVERRVLAGLDERRARAASACRASRCRQTPRPRSPRPPRRIASIGDGAAVRWVAAPELPAALAATLARGEAAAQGMRTPSCRRASWCPRSRRSRAGRRVLLDDGLIDRDTFVVARDLAARVAVAVQRAQAVSELHDARRLAALGQFAAAIAHDIRTPLTSISLNVQIPAAQAAAVDDDREHLDIALEELARLDRSVAEILDFAKPVEADVGADRCRRADRDHPARTSRRCSPSAASRSGSSPATRAIRSPSRSPCTAIRRACARC